VTPAPQSRGLDGPRSCFPLPVVLNWPQERKDILLSQNINGLVAYHFESLSTDGLVHAVFTRLGGVSRGPFATLNTGHTVGDDEAAVAENHARIYNYLGLSADQVATAHLVHSNHITVISSEQANQVLPSTDGLATATPGLALMLRFADCQPIILYDRAHHALALIHAGWRGVAQGIAARAVEAMEAAFGSKPPDLLVGLGPAIGPCCYTVGDDVAAAMGYALPDWHQAMQATAQGWRLDLSTANTQQLAAVGVQHIERSDLCTSCHNDRFFSHRAEKGHTGRFATVAYLQPRDSGRAERETQAPGSRPKPAEPREQGVLNPPGFPPLQELFGEHK